MNYYNDIDPNTCAWTEELIRDGVIPPGDVVCKSIADTQPEELNGYTQVHFFNGVSGWARAARLAGWPEDRPAWFASCPCQPFSVAGKGLGTEDERHLWPELFRLIKARHPEVVFGEQVASSEVVGSQLEAAFIDAVQKGDFATVNRIANHLVKSPAFGSDRRWLDGIQDDLESLNYAVGSSVLAASSVGAPHKRQRLCWVAHNKSQGRTGMVAQCASGFEQRARIGSGSTTDTLANGTSGGQRINGSAPGQRGHADQCGEVDTLGDGIQPGLEGHSGNGDDRDQPGRDDTREVGPIAAAGCTVPVVQPDSAGRQPGRPATTTAGHGGAVKPAGSDVAVGNSEGREQRRLRESGESIGRSGEDRGPGAWDNFQIIQTRDGKFRRIPNAESELQRVANVVSSHLDAMRNLGLSEEEIKEITQAMSGFPLAGKIPGRVMLLKGFGNAILPELAAEFIKASREAIEGTNT